MLFALLANRIAPTAVHAEEPFFEFTEALRERGFSDTALEYLDTLDTRTDIPVEIKQSIPFERAITLLKSAGVTTNPTDRNRLLDRAMAELQRFLDNVPKDHPDLGRANSELARIYVGKCQVAVIKSRQPDNASQKETLLAEGRTHIAKAREILEAAHTHYEAEYKKFPVFIPTEEKEQLAARRAAETNLMRAKLELAKTWYEEAQTWDRSAPEFQTILTDAAEKFEEIHSRYRTQVVGLYARMWMGKCFEEQEEIGKALGFYNELLSHPGDAEVLRRLQDEVLHFRMICLNHEQRRDHHLVVTEASEWMKNRRHRTRSITGVGILWERARALEQLGLNVDLPVEIFDFIDIAYNLAAIEQKVPRGEQDEFFAKALTDAEIINKFPGPYRDPSRALIQRLEVMLNRAGGDPQSFDAATSLAGSLMKKISKATDDLKKARDPETRQQLQQEIQSLKNRAIHVLRVGLKLATEETDERHLNDARYRLAYLHYINGDDFETAVLGGFVGHAAKPEQAVSLDSAYLQMAAWVRAYNNANKKDRDFELQQIIKTAEFITETWSDSDRAQDARMRLADLYRLQNEPAKAAEWYTQIPQVSPKYPDAQLAAGQAYLAAYLALSISGEKSPEELQSWQDKAEQHLLVGIAEISKQVPEESDPPESLIAAKLSHVQILVGRAKYDDALKSLTEGNHSIINAVQVPETEARPGQGMKSRDFASLAYQMLLRCYVGTEQIDQALTAMEELEKIASVDNDPEALLRIYEELGRELEQELQRLKGLQEDERLSNLRKSFDTFLSRLFERKDELKFNSLIWIAQTYFSIGEGTANSKTATAAEKEEAATYFTNAAQTYQSILDLASAKPDEVPAAQVPGVKLLLVKCKRRGGKYQEAYDLVVVLLKENAFRLDAQVEAAYVLQEWGTSGKGDTYKKLIEAMGQRPQDGGKGSPVWGWGGIAIQLKRLIDAGRGKEIHEERRFEARHNLYFCQHQYALNLSGGKRKEELEKAKLTLSAFARLNGDIPEVWRDKLNNIYRLILKDLGEPLADLPEYEPPVLIDPVALNEPIKEDKGDQSANVKMAEKIKQAKENSMSPAVAIILVLLGLGIAGAMAFVMSRKKPRRSYQSASMPDKLPTGSRSGSSGGGKPRTKSKSQKPQGSSQRNAEGKPQAKSQSKSQSRSGSRQSSSKKPSGGGGQKPTRKK